MPALVALTISTTLVQGSHFCCLFRAIIVVRKSAIGSISTIATGKVFALLATVFVAATPLGNSSSLVPHAGGG